MKCFMETYNNKTSVKYTVVSIAEVSVDTSIWDYSLSPEALKGCYTNCYEQGSRVGPSVLVLRRRSLEKNVLIFVLK